MIEVVCNGVAIQGFQDVRITRSMSSFCGSYSMSIFRSGDQSGSAWIPIYPGDNVEIRIDGERVMDAWNDASTPSFNTSGFGCNIQGREINCDMVDCVPEQLNYDGKNLDEICRAISAEFGLRYDGSGTADVGGTFKKFSANPGASAYEVMLAACQERRVLPVSDGSGHVRLDGGNYPRASVDLVQGKNVLQASGHFNISARYSHYTVYAAKDFKGKTFATVEDESVERTRKWVMLDERWATKENCEARAMWEARKRQAQSSTLNVTVGGFRQAPGGKLWTPGELVAVDAPAILGNGIQEFLIDKVVFGFGSDGSKTMLTLVDPDIFAPAPKFPEAKKKVTKKKPVKDAWANVRKQTGSKLK